MTDQTSFHERIGRRRVELFRIAVLVTAFVALIVSAAVTVGASPAASGAPAAQSPGASPGTGGHDGKGGFFGRFRLPIPFVGSGGFGPGPSVGGDRFGGFVGFGGGVTITKVDGSSISLKTDDGWTRTITVTADTKITKGTETGSLSDLQVGDQIRFSQSKQSDGSYTITRIAIIVPRVDGTVSATSSTGFTVKQGDGSTKSVTTSGATKYQLGTGTGSQSDVTVGSRVDVQGTPGSGDSFAASVVVVQPAFVAGTVTATTSDTITVKKFDGSTATIHVGSGTTFRLRGVTSPTVGSVKVGDIVTATGRLRSDGSLDAQAVAGGSFKRPDRKTTPASPGASQPSS